MDDVINFLDKSIEEVVNKAKLKGKIIIAIDFHDREYYGDMNDVWVVGGKYKNGTCWFHRYATVEIVSRRKRIALGAIPIHVFSSKEEVVKVLVERVLRYVKKEKIELVMLDRGFFSSPVISVLQILEMDFLMPVVENRRIKYINNSVYGYEMKGVKFNLIVGGKRKWATSLKEIPRRLSRIYKRRWRMETGYKTKKDFKINTTTPNPVIRTLFFFVEVLMYNIWMLSNVIPTVIKRAIETIRLLKRISTRVLKRRILGIP